MTAQAEYARRRDQFFERMGEGVAVIPSAPVAIRNNDVEHDYRQDSDFYYLTGFDEPESVLVMTSHHDKHRVILFVRPRNPERETWDGARAGVEGAVQDFGADAAFPIASLDAKLPEYMTDAPRLHYRVGEQRGFDDRVFRAMGALRAKIRQGRTAPREIVDTALTLHDMRLRKSRPELDAMAAAAAVTDRAHRRAMEVARPGRHEYEVEAELLRVFRAAGAERPAYGSIVGSGPNATVLHHRRNDRLMQDGDLLLIDAGAEVDYYACDVTRTFPINGRFSAPQRAVYDVVLAAQKTALNAVKPGVTFQSVHETAVEVLAAGLIELGILQGTLKEVRDKESYKPYYMHKTSHWLGMDVHDVGDYYQQGQSRVLQEGMVLTVEPGLYITAQAEVEPAYRGIGIRIEDDVVVTAAGHHNLTETIPKEANELEDLLGARR